MKQHAEIILLNGTIYTLDDSMTKVEAMAVRNGRIAATGTNTYILQQFTSENTIDLHGKPVYPGFIDSHAHFTGYALGTKTMAGLSGARSEEEMIERVRQFHDQHPSAWVAGRGWDQNLWPGKTFPDNSLLNKVFPDIPAVLIRIDGHAILANSAAISALGITETNLAVKAQAQLVNGRFTGLFFEETADRFKEAIPPQSRQNMVKFLSEAETDCFSFGLTTVADAGLTKERVLLLDSLQNSGYLNIRVYAMLEPSEENIDHFINKGICETNSLNVRSIKLYADGALGSRGACLLRPYSDDPDNFGVIVTSADKIRKYCKLAYDHGYQVNTHCIGDSANRMVLNIYGEFLKGKNDRRWRIEHAQVVDPQDMPMFQKYSIIPAIQSTHATSDMYWAGDRLGPERINNAYAYKTLLEQNGWLPNGTDFPVEKISPLLSFYAAVARKDLKGWPEQGFLMGNALSREQALRSITIWAAKACFDEKIKGSLEAGKLADFVILDNDIMEIPLTEVPSTTILRTYISGQLVFEKKK
ncbi:MAG: amidohydrolase [Bacteroidetes bacterium]|nr:amidohydrolase [Bacteroidota bacterium]